MAKSRKELPHLRYPRQNVTQVINSHRFPTVNTWLDDAMLVLRGPDGFTDQSGASVGITNGSVTTVADTGASGTTAFEQNASGDELRTDETFAVSGNKTFGVWCKSTGITSDHQFLFDNRSGSTTRRTALYLTHSSPNRVQVVYGDGSNIVGLSDAVDLRNDNTWHLIICEIEFGVTARLFIDGSLSDSADVSSISAQTTLNNLVIGSGYVSNSVASYYSFRGRYDAVHVWDRLLSSSEKSAWYTAGRDYDG